MKGQALLIGIQNYTQTPRLPGVSADVRLLRETLVEHGGYEVASINDSAAVDDSIMFSKSEREKLQDAIEAWLAARSSDETVFLYFSGHGFRDKQDRLYLAAVDCDPQNPELGGVPVAWLRERLVACPAKMKLLVLDACHAGSAKGASKGIAVEARELTDFFGQIKGLITLASCTGEQKSILWAEKGQSLFTYWLAQGLSGHADREPLGEITVNELEDFVAKKVRRSAKVVASVQQTPTRLQGPGVTEDVILQMRPISYKSLIENLAEQMDAVIRLEGIERVGIVPRFVCGMAGQLLGRDYGLWTDNALADLAAELAQKGQGDYRVISISGRVEPIAQQEEAFVPPELEQVQIEVGPSHPLADPTFPYRARFMIEVVDAQRSFAANAGYSDQLGLITVAFFEPQEKPKSKPLTGGRGSVGIGSGGRYQTQTDEYDGNYIPGRMLAVLHIRYGE